MNTLYEAQEEEKEIDLLEYWRVIYKRKWVAVAFICTVVLFAGIYSFKVAPKYKAVATLMVDEENTKMLSIEGEFGYRQRVTDLRFFNTQLKLLKSYSLIERVAKKLDLLNHLVFLSEKNGNSSKQKKNDLFPDDPYYEITDSVMKSMEVSPLRETKLVELSYISTDPFLASQVTNTIAEEFIEFYIEKRFETTKQASKFLVDQIEQLRLELAEKENELQAYGEEKGIYFLSDEESTAVNTFADLNKALTNARIERIKAESSYRELKELKVDALPQFVNNKVIQDLKTDYSRIKNEFEEKSKVFKPEYPEMISLKAKLESMRNELEGEISRAVEAARTEYRTALNKENSLDKLYEQQKDDVARMNSSAIAYNSIKIEVENLRKLQNSLVERQKETLVSSRLEGVKTSNITIIDKAKVPRSPVSPKKKRNLVLAFLVGLFGGVGLCFGLDYLDNTVKNPEDVEKLAHMPSLGMIPNFTPNHIKKGGKGGYSFREHYASGGDDPQKDEKLAKLKHIELINHLHPGFYISDDYRTVRTSILLSSAEEPPKTISITSAMPGEGKTCTAVNLAVAFSQLKEKVLIVDADLRRPRMHRIFKLKNIGGLSGYLTGKVNIEEAIHKSNISNIWVLPSGPIPPNPSELLNSDKMQRMLDELKKGFEVIILDSPPVMAVIDPVITASIVDGTIIVVQSGDTKDKAFIDAAEELRRGKAKILGAVLNRVKLDKTGYYSSKYYKSPYRYKNYGE